MTAPVTPAGFETPLHRALVEPILLGGVPRSIAIVNGTVAAALGLGLQQWIAGVLIWVSGIVLPCSRPASDADFAGVLVRHLRHKAYWSC